MAQVFQRTKHGREWTKKNVSSNGTSFTIDFDRFELMLKTGEVPSGWTLRQDEVVDRFEFTDRGVQVWLGRK